MYDKNHYNIVISLQIKKKKKEKKKRERSFQTPVNTLSGRSVASLGISEGKITGRKNK